MIRHLPDDFLFKLNDAQKIIAMNAVRHEILHEGQTNPIVLAEIARKFTWVILEDANA